MSKFTVLVILVALRICYQPSVSATNYVQGPQPFAIPSTLEQTLAKFIDFKGAVLNDKVTLQWKIDENETADQFEVEKSRDGKNFEMAALVFATDLPDSGDYTFFEKNKHSNISYRIKLINKDKRIEYSNIVVIRS